MACLYNLATLNKKIMKLIIVLSDDSYAEETAKIFSKNQIPIFSEMDIKGFKN